MSETSGGCVYDGVPLPQQCRAGRRRRPAAPRGRHPRHRLPRPTRPHRSAFWTDADGQRWFRTDDTGHQDPDGRWHVDGRLDDLITTGGLKVAPRLVEEALLDHLDGVAEAVVVGVDDPEWGQVVSAAVTLRPGAPAPTVSRAREALRGILPDHALPRQLLVLDALPLRGPGKPDRRAIRAALSTVTR